MDGAALPERFAAAMAALGPYETAPALAVAVSGGADSRTLALLADTWARGQGGRIVAFVIDHGLRPESAEEARVTLAWLADRGIAAEGRTVTVAPGNMQSEARQARYAALEALCAGHRMLHLLLGHHALDKRETLMMRWIRGSGPAGLASMRPLDYRRSLRVLRPLLGEEPETLRDWLGGQGEAWIDDPGNNAPQFQRVRLRPMAAALREEGWSAARLSGQQAWLDAIAQEEDRRCALFLSRHAMLHPAGFARLDPAAIRAMPEAAGVTALTRLLAALRGRGEPRRDEVARLWRRMAGGSAFQGATLHGCRLLSFQGKVYLCRESPPPARVPLDGRRWDDRFRLAHGEGEIGYLGDAWREGRDLAAAHGWRQTLPPAVWQAIPAWWRLDRTMTLPHILGEAGRAVPIAFQPAKSAC